MEPSLSQQEINDAEWHNPDNWIGVGLWKMYVGKRDSRVWVPMWWNGTMSPQTINFGHRLGFLVKSLLFYLFCGIAATIVWMVCHNR